MLWRMAQHSIRLAGPPDAAVIASFNAAMARETEHLELDPARLRAGVEAVLLDSSKGFYLLAEDEEEQGGRIIGQLMITYEWSDWRNGVFWWIQSVYVAPESRGRGTYRRLYEHVRKRAAEAGNVCGLRLYVERDNKRAQAVYIRQGMRATAYDMYEVDFVLSRS